jgi:uncharacterized membrane protein
MKKLVGPLVILCVLAYPFFVYWGLNRFSLKLIGWLFLAVLVARSLVLKKQIKQSLPLICGVSTTAILLSIYNDPLYLKLNPVIISSCVLLTFSWTLVKAPSMIETFARMADKNLPDKAIPYCRKVTIIWVIFLFLNTLAAIYTCFYTDIKTWMFYNGFLSYIFMGVLFAGEFTYRKIFIK